MELSTLYRECTLNQVSENDIGKERRVAGWVENIRDHGGVSFVDLRDMYGVLQIVMRDTSLLKGINKEDCISVLGKIEKRDEETYNPKIPTGTIELEAHSVEILGKVYRPLPFEIATSKEIREDLRLKYRFLDLRNPKVMSNMIFRSNVIAFLRQKMTGLGFMEVQTPILCASSPEGARDYLIPSRVHNGKFYALPQSPQIYKQLLMVAGMDRYIQLARCFRDEDLRADRQPEFTQIDLEMSFVDVEDILNMTEGFIEYLFKNVLGMEISMPIPRLSYTEAMNRYGSDKPDTRFDMEIQDLSETIKDCNFAVFADAVKNGGSVRAIVAKNSASVLTRKEIDKLTEMARGIGAKGLAYVRWVDEKPSCSFAKFFSEDEITAILNKIGCEKGDTVLIIADKNKITLPVLGALRLHVAKKLDIIPENKFNFLWITEFPFFEFDEDSQSYVAMHHPFTMPNDECIRYLESAPEKVFAKAFDLVLNGTELSSGSIRITDFELQQKMFQALGLTDEEIESKFGFLVEAYKYGAPPHGGLGIGLDRLAMVMLGAESLRDITAFPKVQNASELMSECPSKVDKENLEALGIDIIYKAD